MKKVWLVKATDTVWGNGSPGLDVDVIIAVCTNEEEAKKLEKEVKGGYRYDDVWIEEERTNELFQ